MAYVITEGCIGCGECKTICPFGAVMQISDTMYEIDESLCAECSACAGVCPLNIISKN